MSKSSQVLIDAFLAERNTPNPLGDRSPTWGRHVDDLSLVDPGEIAESVVVIEPWEHVGERPKDKVGVIASENVAYIVDQILGLPTLIVPAWKHGISDLKRFASLASVAKLIVLEGGEPDVHVKDTFSPAFPRSDATQLIVEFLLKQVPFIGICLSHQLTAQAHVELIRESVDRLEKSQQPAFVAVSRRIAEVANRLKVEKSYGTVAQSWNDESFAVAKNEAISHSNTRLYPYRDIDIPHVPIEITETYRVVAKRFDAIIDVALQYENDLHIQAFHGNEVSEESIRFVCWAYQQIHHAVTAYSLEAASILDLQSLMDAPIGVEILASTHTQSGDPLCEVAATGIYWDNGRKALTTQFHPELDESLITASEGWALSWEDMKNSDGIRLLARILQSVL
ncbi:MAG: hypothetical protein F6K48_03985 [Okeania sp. SIO3H1]|uniref:glutamine amidotransferase-related protein n=1 Tax=Okeania sp. SIO1I7 TaxID=2607772 RepID=UPI0013C8C1BE|nr:hypothetical protein [Okeania sp. SIO1I7]NEN88120.1 hypothetical protein [Okeania sp. SIO3H1]NET26123.1 hypothetical protein [Okeania sp. SIO1I7]